MNKPMTFIEWCSSNGKIPYSVGIEEAYEAGQQSQQAKVEKLQKRVDAVKGLAQTLWEKSNEKHNQGKVWESKALGECADEILDVLEQALKGEGQ
ncbi:hypothetical protein [Acinetobacter baumannii]|uniref:hypothetical protein n=1 Tax=Acinetobacter baumannii TaxID=470 RepID=UPI00406D0AC6